MNVKRMFEIGLVRYAGLSLFKKYINKKSLDDKVIEMMILEKKDEYLEAYMQVHKLSDDQVTSILSRNGVDGLMLSVVKNDQLNEEQQEILVKKNNTLLLESYLSPAGFFDLRRRFSKPVEYLFINSIIKSEKMVGLEIFKTYIDNFYRTIWSEDLFNLLMKNNASLPAQYIFRKVHLPRDLEERFISEASEALIRDYLQDHHLNNDNALLLLVEEKSELAELYYEKYKLRGKAQEVYFRQRQQNYQTEKEAEET